ncbi:MAG: hypothetical protein H6742_15030 [Alphaproteobacteria bacterium]|nr:hypothetical protein [Alphaproteobacteria bacterium]
MSRLLCLLLFLAAGPARAAGESEPLDAAIRGQHMGLLLLAGGAVALGSGLGVVEVSAPPPGADYSHPLEQRRVGPAEAVGGSMAGVGALSAVTGAVVLGVYGLDGAAALRDRGRRGPRWAGRASLGLLVAAPVSYLAAGELTDLSEPERRRWAVGAFGGGVALGALQLGMNLTGRRSWERTVQVRATGPGVEVAGTF